METTVKITWDKPEEQQWLCADNIKIALSQHCKNTKFDVIEIQKPKDFKERLNIEKDLQKIELINYLTGFISDSRKLQRKIKY